MFAIVSPSTAISVLQKLGLVKIFFCVTILDWLSDYVPRHQTKGIALQTMPSVQMSVRGVNMSQIHALTSRITDLERSASSWNNAYVVFVALTVLLAVGLFVTQFIAIRKGRQLVAAQSELLRLKDDELKKNLGEKDEKIAGLNLQAESLKVEAERAKEGIATAQTAAARANADAAKASERAAEANRKAEEERLTRVKLEETLAPRLLAINVPGQLTLADFKLFSGTKVAIFVVPELESRRLAGQITRS
jgi:hypothetical protein